MTRLTQAFLRTFAEYFMIGAVATATALFVTISLSGQAKPSDTAAPFTELESARIDNVRLRGVILQREYDDWHALQSTLKADIERARPGWIWNAETGAFTKKETK